MITFDQVTKGYLSQQVMSQASFHVSAGERVGLVGPNGAGKTTLFRLILGQESPDGGAIHRTKGLSIGHLPQEVEEVGAEPLLELVMATAEDLKAVEAELEVVAEELGQDPPAEELELLTRRQSHLLERYEGLDGYTLKSRAEKILEGLGFQSRDFHRPVAELSGGWRMRALLARILLADPDLILLDEPTNHLDLNSLIWLEDYLQSVTATVIIVSHDRAFLNRTVRKIIELESGRLKVFPGDYEHYRLEKDKEVGHLWAAYRQQQEKIKQIQQFIYRNRSRKDRARQVQARLKLLDKMERLQPPAQEHELTFFFPPASRPPAVLARLDKVGLSYGGGEPVYDGLSLEVGRGDRIALVGPNGAGKSSLLKLLSGELAPTRGLLALGPGVGVGYFAQHQLEQLRGELTVMEELMTVSGQTGQTQLRGMLGSFLFRGDDVFKKVSVLSGGERSRLVLCKLLFSGAHLLLLDEPTNHLDIPSRIALGQALEAWSGSLVLVSHDRQLLGGLVNRVWEVNPGGRVEVFPGNLEDYLRTWQRLKTGPAEAPQDRARPGKAKRDKARRRQEAEWRQAVGRQTKVLKDRLAEIEARVAGAEAEVDQLNASLADPKIYQDPEQAGQLSRRLAQVKDELARLNQAWTESALVLEEETERLMAQTKEAS